MSGKNEMKIVVQNGCKHPITRTEMERVSNELPSVLVRDISSICLYKSCTGENYVTFHAKEKLISFFGGSCALTLENKVSALEELVVSLVLLKSNGDIPSKVSKSKRKQT